MTPGDSKAAGLAAAQVGAVQAEADRYLLELGGTIDTGWAVYVAASVELYSV